MIYDKQLEVSSLMAQLDGLGVSLPLELTQTADQLLRVSALRPTPAPPAKLIGLDDDEFAAVFRDLGVACALSTPGRPGERAVELMRTAVADALASEMLLLADDILDQLRPAFDEACTAVHEMTELGFHPRTKAEDILRADDVSAARDAWAALPELARKLDTIALARIQLSRATGAPPTGRHRSMMGGMPETVEDVAGAMFREDARPWQVDLEADWQRWLRLNTGTPARLLSLAAAADAVQGLRTATAPAGAIA